MNNCTSRGRFFKYRPRRFKLVIDSSVGFCMSLANSFVEYDKSGRSCDKCAALITTLNCLVCNASNCGDVINTSPSLFLTDGVVTPFALSRFHDFTINSACRGSGSYSIQLLSPSEFHRTYRFRILTSLASSRLAPRIARTLKGYTIILVYHHECVHFVAVAHSRLDPPEFNVSVSSRSHAAAASRVPYMARCNRQTIPGGSSASGGGSTYNSRNTSLHRCAFFTSMKLSFNG